ncbi:MAG TPA: tetratricopeptide repeat protein, partial [Anaerolineaceae bacterium]|nr:tetratricopeptide repeat protein [Anaerolineaceae bacterium]
MLIFILAGLFVIRGLKTGAINPMIQTTVTPTRSLNSFAQEGQTHFQAGNLEKAIEAYKNAILIDPGNTTLRAELARIQVYSTSQITVDADKRARYDEALAILDEGL